MSDPAASLPTLDAVSQAIESMNALTAKLDGFITSQADRRRRDKRVIGGFVIVLLVAIGGTWYSSNKAANSKHDACVATNKANQTIHDLFAPLNTFTPTVITPRMSPDEIAAAKVADVKRKAANDAFFADLNERTAPTAC